ncbi:hypothetical protein O1Q96_25190 [Streptomyces sp. Qhu-G9]|uniref:hypothetical protein n=1 Tax=Streptomyces sp. Qhu-G9 TaxID=3452799 RepID=UPI0022AC4B91|nr:hypothetical protein [Streptomyces aurantiacus]WAU86679.1 hypothetical protein O1Q96_25190 [Streptomyces aurantiacus]
MATGVLASTLLVRFAPAPTVTVYSGAVLAGIAFGAVSQGALRMLLASLDERDRAATLAA